MAAAEARAIWQRIANRCLVQEDTKTAAKFACCQSSSSHKMADSCSIGVADALDWIPQPSYGSQKGTTNELTNVLNPVECHNSMQTNGFCYDREPWWHTTDEEDLASLVARKSMDVIENCDLPPPQKMYAMRYSHERSGSFDKDECCRIGPIPITFRTTQKDFMQQVTESSPTKAQLLEAIRRSQTRAREAEKAAKQADAEKERFIELFFKQASQISAYKQWFNFKMLQLDALYLQMKNNKSHKSSIIKHAVSFAFGLCLVGAGLLLGWTVGWMLPF